MIAHKVRLNPTDGQARTFEEWAESARRAWNWALSEWERQYRDRVGGQRFKVYGRAGVVPVGEPWSADPDAPYPTAASLSRLLTKVRREAPAGTMEWMRPPFPARVYRRPISNLAAAWAAFHRRRNAGQRVGGPSNPFGAPMAKRHDGPRTFYLSGQDLRIAGRYIELPRGHRLRLLEAPRFRARVVGSTFSQHAGRWSVALVMEFDRKRQPPESGTHAGVRLGTSALATVGARTAALSPEGGGSGSVLLEVDGPSAHVRGLRRQGRLSKDVSRKKKGSHNRRKALQRLWRHHARMVNLRGDALHKLTTEIVRRAASVGIEDLAGVVEDGRTSRAVADLGIYEFRRQLEYKAAEAGIELTVADKQFPASSLCSACGERDQDSKERRRGVRRWTCPRCGTEHDRDLNAAVNLDPVSFGAGPGGPELPVQ